VETSVIGSYPYSINTLDIMRRYFSQESTDRWKETISSAVKDMVQTGISIISDGQTRDPFIQLFTRKLNGCRIRARTEIVDTITYGDPITVKDQRYVKSIIPSNTRLKGVITGPWTLTCSCVDMFYNDNQKVAFDFAEALAQEAKNLEEHVDFLSIDEPFFSQDIPDFALDLFTILTKDIRIPVILHVCGDITQIIPKIIELPVDILSHEFKASPQLLTEFNKYSFSQDLCLGSVRSDDIQVESVEEIEQHIHQAFELFGEKIIHIAPDCGQRLLPREVALNKLQNLVEAGGLFNAR
jgi:5-methyltetrahydropteroyltriglutamate--homocysteine methyltransferase